MIASHMAMLQGHPPAGLRTRFYSSQRKGLPLSQPHALLKHCPFVGRKGGVFSWWCVLVPVLSRQECLQPARAATRSARTCTLSCRHRLARACGRGCSSQHCDNLAALWHSRPALADLSHRFRRVFPLRRVFPESIPCLLWLWQLRSADLSQAATVGVVCGKSAFTFRLLCVCMCVWHLGYCWLRDVC